MTKEERLERARQSLARAITHKDERDVSDEICSCIANLMAVGEPFSALETSEHEIRSILGQGCVSETRAILSRWSPVPRPNEDLPQVRLKELIKQMDAAYSLVEVKMDNDAAIFLGQNDPFLSAYEAPDSIEKGRAETSALLQGVDLDALFEAAETPAASGLVMMSVPDDDPVIEIASEEFLDEIDEEDWFIIVSDPIPLTRKMKTSIPPPLPAHAGIGDSPAERQFFARTG